jgi:uncharacterized protein (TIGR02679 family)
MTAAREPDHGGGEPAGGGDRAALDRLLGTPETAWLVERVRSRILGAQGEPLTGVVRLDRPSEEQRAAAVRLVGRPRRPGAALRVYLADVEQILRRGPWPAGLSDAVQTLTGPLVDHREERTRVAAEWNRAGEGMDPAIRRFPSLGAWWETFCADGGLKRAARAEAVRTSRAPSPAVAAELVLGVGDVLDALPASAEPLAVLARRVAGDAHALDTSRPLGRLAAAAVGAAFQLPETGPATRFGASVRDSWAAAGVVLSSVASTVLCLGVPGLREGAGASPVAGATATALEAMREARTPMLLTLDQVRSGGVSALPETTVLYVCENPTVVEVVAERWARSATPTSYGDGPVLVCTSGQPSTAVVALLERLTGLGADCRYHGDFDWAGLRIARSLSNHIPWIPWRYTSADYRAAVQHKAPSLSLAGRPAESPWDPTLTVVMAECGLAIEEEAVAGLLAEDLLPDET